MCVDVCVCVVCVCGCVCVACVCLCVPVCVYMCACTCMCVDVCVCCVCVLMCTCVCVHVCVHVHVCVCLCVCVCVRKHSASACVCMFINTFLAVFPAATDQEIEAFWEIIHSVDDAVTRDDHAKRVLTNRPALKQFIEHCCHVRHYQFAIKKCGDLPWNICKLPRPVFQSLHHIPGQWWTALQTFWRPVWEIYYWTA